MSRRKRQKAHTNTGGDVSLAYVHGTEVAHSWHRSIMEMVGHDLEHGGHLGAWHAVRYGTGGISWARNEGVRAFLKAPTEWLMWVDTDMGIPSDAIDRLLEVADPDTAPIVGGLCFMWREFESDGLGGFRTRAVPTLMDWVQRPDGHSGFVPRNTIDADTVTRVAGTGSACIVIHRTVFEKIADRYGEGSWYEPMMSPHSGMPISEDLAFCARATVVGCPIWVHTGVKTSHLKQVWVTDEHFDAPPPPSFALIPTCGARPDLLRDLLAALDDEKVPPVIVDTGMPASLRAELDGHMVVNAEGHGVSAWWNQGLDWIAEHHQAGAYNVAILNDDIRCGPKMVTTMAKALRSSPDVAVAGPAQRPGSGSGVLDVNQIAAGHQDNRGLPGWAFMVRSEDGYRFPDDLVWWFGDNDLVASARVAGMRVVLALDTWVEHVDGGSQTGDWTDPETAAVLAADQRAFEAKWRTVLARQDA